MSNEMTPEMAEAAKAYFAALAAGICPTCNAKIEKEKQVGRCVYALPCYHRLYQGTAKPKEPKLHPFLREQAEREQKLQEGQR